ncbi:hypothetical protein DQ353_02875 [Arthrobacter sp. AQ5-05]|nr:hypothetical protein DQ353_02875 [Arthrobacter sp. AQ5-05]
MAMDAYHPHASATADLVTKVWISEKPSMKTGKGGATPRIPIQANESSRMAMTNSPKSTPAAFPLLIIMGQARPAH